MVFVVIDGAKHYFVPVLFPNGTGPFLPWQDEWGDNPSESPYFDPEWN